MPDGCANKSVSASARLCAHVVGLDDEGGVDGIVTRRDLRAGPHPLSLVAAPPIALPKRRDAKIHRNRFQQVSKIQSQLSRKFQPPRQVLTTT
eukprot:COSAG04_NODE_23807_length_332_cov_0.373391_1_plen_92_part_10